MYINIILIYHINIDIFYLKLFKHWLSLLKWNLCNPLFTRETIWHCTIPLTFVSSTALYSVLLIASSTPYPESSIFSFFGSFSEKLMRIKKYFSSNVTKFKKKSNYYAKNQDIGFYAQLTLTFRLPYKIIFFYLDFIWIGCHICK